MVEVATKGWKFLSDCSHFVVKLIAQLLKVNQTDIKSQSFDILPISVVIPTCNRKERLLSLLRNLNSSSYPFTEVIVIDSGEARLCSAELDAHNKLNIQYYQCEKSVCIQRNMGIKLCRGSWIFLCDDDIKVPSNYIERLVNHVLQFPQTGAVSGLVLQKSKGRWVHKYSINSTALLLWNCIFKLSIWGDIDCKKNWLTNKIVSHYEKKGNHLTKAGWPVLTNFSGDYFTTPLYGLGASMIKKDWLAISPYDDVLDRHGIGDNFGVATGFPGRIHVLNNAYVYHHEESSNRLNQPLQYYRRVLALDYFRQMRPQLEIKKHLLLWSLLGNLLLFMRRRDTRMIYAGYKSIATLLFSKNPYLIARQQDQKRIEPELHK